MDEWEILGIEQTTELTVIKKAYAALAAKYHPEENPEEFQRIRKAYKEAVSFAKKSYKKQETHDEKGENSQTGEGYIIIDDVKAGQTENHLEKFQQDVLENQKEEEFNFDDILYEDFKEKFIRDFSLIARNPFLKNNIKCWEYYFNKNMQQTWRKNKIFFERLEEEMCKYPGWMKYTISYFEGKFQKYTGEEMMLLKVRGEKKKNDFYTTPKQRQVNDMVMKHSGIKDLNDDDSINKYLDCYFKMIDDFQIEM